MAFVEQVSSWQSNQLAKTLLPFQYMQPIATNLNFLYLQSTSNILPWPPEGLWLWQWYSKTTVAMDPFADVLLHELSSIKLIEDLAKDESIEDQGIPHLLTHIEY